MLAPELIEQVSRDYCRKLEHDIKGYHQATMGEMFAETRHAKSEPFLKSTQGRALGCLLVCHALLAQGI